MVVQPPIIFGEASQGGTNFDTDYMIGLAFAAVFLASGIKHSHISIYFGHYEY